MCTKFHYSPAKRVEGAVSLFTSGQTRKHGLGNETDLRLLYFEQCGFGPLHED